MRTYYLASAGCPRRAVDSQKIADYLEANNLKYTQDVKDADLIIVSTCAALAREVSSSIIRKMPGSMVFSRAVRVGMRLKV